MCLCEMQLVFSKLFWFRRLSEFCSVEFNEGQWLLLLVANLLSLGHLRFHKGDSM